MHIKDIESIYPLTPLQRLVFEASQGDAQGGSTPSQVRCRLTGELEPAVFEQAWSTIVSRHPALRSMFVKSGDNKLLQAVRRTLAVPVAHQDLSAEPAAGQVALLEGIVESERDRGFELATSPLIRVSVYHLADGVKELVWDFHPALLDERSVVLALREVLDCYAHLVRGEEWGKDEPVPYRDYVRWRKQHDGADAMVLDELLAGAGKSTPLIVDRRSLDGGGAQSGVASRPVPAAAVAPWTEAARGLGIDVETLVLGAWALLLSRLTGNEEVVFGTLGAAAPPGPAGIDSMLGLFERPAPLAARVRRDATVRSWLEELQRRFRALAHDGGGAGWLEAEGLVDRMEHDLPCETVVVLDDPRRHGLIGMRFAELEVRDLHWRGLLSAPVKLVPVFDEEEARLELRFERTRLDDAAATRALEGVQTLIDNLVARPEAPLARISILSDAQTRQLLFEWNDTDNGDPLEQCLHELIEAQVERTPDHPALEFEGRQLSYRELNDRANRLANHLRSLGVGVEVPVAVCIDRCLEMVVGILGVLKAGGTFVPVDPTYPTERINFVLADSQPPIVLTREELLDELPSQRHQVICLDSDWPRLAASSAENPASGASPDNLAYIIYTSGSTGTPKGVMVPHRGVANSSKEFVRLLQMPPGSRMLQFASLSFDVSIFEIVPALISGQTLCLARQEALLGENLLTTLAELQITIATVPPSILATLPVVELPALNRLLVAGEAFTSELVARWVQGRRFFNAYGPTEGSIWTAGAYLTGDQPPAVGKPLANTRIYLLDSDLQPVPVGVPGELYIGGVAPTRGYLRRPALTAERFVPDPFSDRPAARLYRTGDLASYRAGGTIEYVGRVDHQVKLRGFRIELGETEVALHGHPAVRQAVVVLREDTPNERRLVAYLTTRPGRTATSSDLHNYLANKLPDYMVPAVFVTVEAMPLNKNGKVDRAALPAPDQQRPILEHSYVAPRDAVEEALAAMWIEVLGIERVGIHDNFFQLGGHSLTATQVISRMRNAFNVDYSLMDFFETPTIADLSTAIGEQREGAAAVEQPQLVASPRDRHRVKRVALD